MGVQAVGSKTLAWTRNHREGLDQVWTGSGLGLDQVWTGSGPGLRFDLCSDFGIKEL